MLLLAAALQSHISPSHLADIVYAAAADTDSPETQLLDSKILSLIAAAPVEFMNMCKARAAADESPDPVFKRVLDEKVEALQRVAPDVFADVEMEATNNLVIHINEYEQRIAR